ncbi:MAG: penicillin acylase family protein, partial [Halobacteriovoraceae bacterium]|nr:penicillin acylase family protein [Halobacteriovoraceae bacterium]
MGLVFVLLLFVLNSQADYRCRIYRDDGEINHLKGEKKWDVFACMGYIHARDRAFQMEYFRRIAQGKMAEVLGYGFIRSDFFLRLLDLTSHAQRLYDEMDDEDKKWLDSYAAGVNRGFIAGVSDSYQFKELGIVPAPWKPQDSILLFLLQAFDQTRKSFFNEITESGMLEKYSGDIYTTAPWQTTILKKGEYPVRKRISQKTTLKKDLPQILDYLGDLTEFSMGSNNWVVAPRRSKSQNAWFANDPHLKITHPPFWYWIHLTGKGWEAMGASVPGLPTIPGGFNGKLAWGLTNAYVDVADVALIDEKELKDVETLRPVIYFKFWGVKLPFFFKSFRRTKEGYPVLPVEAKKDHAYVLKWSGFFLKGPDLPPLYRILKAKNAKEMDDMLAKVGLPTWNYVFADTRGKIGYRAIGKLPFREGDVPPGVKEQKLADFSKPFRFFKKDEAPHILNPSRGYIATANNRQWGDDSRYHPGNS